MMKHQIDEAFVNQLFAHPAFQLKLKKAQQAISPSLPKKHEPALIPELVEEICGILSAQYKQRVDDQCLSIYKSHLQVIKEIESIKASLSVCSPLKTAASPYKERMSNNSILSEVELDQQSNPSRIRRMPEESRCKGHNTSFMSSFLCESEIKEGREELEERINASIINLSGDVAKFESSVEERLQNVENSLNRKVESIYKSLSSVFETINDLQSKLNDVKQAKEQKEQRDHKREAIDKAIDASLTQRQQKEKSNSTAQKQGEVSGRRRSFLGFLKY